jgi:ubiquinone/menaquinone biosynthesis C-methylase UbiE
MGAPADFTTVTEMPGVMASQAELRQMFTRYHWAGTMAAGRRVLELACGSGPGLGYLKGMGAVNVIGTDIEERNLAHARQHYAGRAGIETMVADALALPFPDASFELVLCFEAIYYFGDLDRFLSEARRVLAPGGQLLISTVNREWPGFNPSPFSLQYPSAGELQTLLTRHGFRARLQAAFADDAGSASSRCKRLLRQTAVRLGLIPRTMKGKEVLKRLFYGRLQPVPQELVADSNSAEPLVEIDPTRPQTGHIFLYATGLKAQDPS